MICSVEFLLLILGPAVLVSATPTPTTAPDLKNAAVLDRRTTCIFTAASAASASKTSCATIVLDNIAVPSGVTLDLTGLNSGTHVIFEGETTWGYEEWSGPLFSVSGENVAISGAPGHSLNANGALWWDGQGSNGGKTKPKFFAAHSLTGKSSITGLNVLNTPVQAFSVNSCTGLTISNVTIDNSAGDVDSLGHNTDGFDVGSSTDVTISGAVVKNQDDCLAINSGTGITFTGGACSGGHGLSIGSVGGRSDNNVSDITISSSTITNSANGVRIKTVSGATGSVSGVKYDNITLSSISTYGIVIEQDYENGSPTGIPTTGVPITDLTLSNIKGTVDSDATNIYILCGSGSCSDWTWSGVAVTGGKESTACENIPSGASC
ncbi:glycoside hydrolase family 28 protein [Amorphotheca resinae ATCC 22711]|uniref:endo-polygalacturonase n=1 Tax=Amorphotheca resinae ATCC 22711 TaxID=857342 RepID=A0A2T3B488_AMORE|nr:glycoside hydrolase family 28 protein [Amorphotheca resinae ATCC 22711]PSS20450.1 glycoside hydrolase family 28 protein [Amorphotheca resinae ATCC 22711]